MDQSLNSMFADKNSMEFAKQNIDTSGKLMLQVGYVFIYLVVLTVYMSFKTREITTDSKS